MPRHAGQMRQVLATFTCPRPITFTCDYCNQKVTEDRARGRVPRYCLACYPKAQHALNHLRVKPIQEPREGARTGCERRPGRPQKG